MRSTILALLAGALVEGQIPGLPGLPPLPIVGGLLNGVTPPATPSLPPVPAVPDVPSDLPATPPLPTGGLPAGVPSLPPLPAGLPALPKQRRQASTGADGIDIGQIIADVVGPNLSGREAQQGSTLNVNGMDVGGVLAGLPVPKGVLPVQALGVTKRDDLDPEEAAELEAEIDGVEGELDERQIPDLPIPTDDLPPIPDATDLPVPDPLALDDSTNARLSITDPAVLPTETPEALLDVARWRTSTVLVTNTITISSCAPTHTDCPYTRHPLTTVTVETSTTVCPVTTSSSSSTTSTCDDGCDETTTVCTDTETGTATSTASGSTTTTDCTDSSTTSWTSSESCTETETTGTPTSTPSGDTTTSCDGRWCHHTKTKTCTEKRCHDPTSTTGGDPTSYVPANVAPTAGAGVAGLLAGLAVVLL